MDFEAEEVVRLREEILRFVLQQLKETAQTGELRKASAALAEPIAAAVEAAVQRAMERSSAAGAAKARLSDVEVKQIARAVAGQLGPKPGAAPLPGQGAMAADLGDGDDQTDDYYSPSSPGGSRHSKPFDLARAAGLGLALLLGIAIGIGLAKVMGQPDSSLVGSEAAEMVPEVQPVATSDKDLQQVEAPPRPAASSAPEQGNQLPQQ